MKGHVGARKRLGWMPGAAATSSPGLFQLATAGLEGYVYELVSSRVGVSAAHPRSQPCTLATMTRTPRVHRRHSSTSRANSSTSLRGRARLCSSESIRITPRNAFCSMDGVFLTLVTRRMSRQVGSRPAGRTAGALSPSARHLGSCGQAARPHPVARATLGIHPATD